MDKNNDLEEPTINQNNNNNENAQLNIRRITIPTAQNNDELKKVEFSDHHDDLSESKSELNQENQELPFKSVVVDENTLKSSLVGSNRNVPNDDTLINDYAVRYDSETLKQYLKTEIPIDDDQDSNQNNLNTDPWEIDRQKGAKVYELIGYTTANKVKHKFKVEQRQFMLRRILITILIVIIIFLVLYIINPIKNFSDFRRIIGIDSMYGDSNFSEEIQDTDEQGEENPVQDTN